VDDSAYNLFVIEQLINMIDPSFEVDSALNGKLAVEKVLSLSNIEHKSYDFIFLDV
jgi:hypothetical protein